MHPALPWLLAFTSLFSAQLMAQAAIPNGDRLATTLSTPAAQSASKGLPRRGQTMVSVEQGFGSPLSRHRSVGDPPITRWVYPGYVVYFEHDHVIQAVPNRN